MENTGLHVFMTPPNNIMRMKMYYDRCFGGSNRTGLFFLSTIASDFLPSAIKIEYKIVYLSSRNSLTKKK